jgi:hypothetical protein
LVLTRETDCVVYDVGLPSYVWLTWNSFFEINKGRNITFVLHVLFVDLTVKSILELQSAFLRNLKH